jgi:predicted dehydrogenase
MKTVSMSRRDFVRLGAGAVVAGAAVNGALLEPATLAAQTATGGRKIRFASIGTGIRGCDLLRSARKLPNGVLVGTADLYDMHQKAGLEAYGTDVPTSRDYRALLDRKDVDAVIVAVTDHQHRRVVLDCIAAGKDVYCEKPMSHKVSDGFAMMDAIQSNKRIFQVGSQRVSSILYQKAAEIYASGRLGEVHSIEGHTDRNSPSGAWVYPIAPDATPQTIDWDTFLHDAPPHAFDPVRFFRWRCFTDYGEGVGGDLFVHLLSGIQFVSGMNTAPSRAYSTGNLSHFKDGRDFPDMMSTLYDYPDVTVSLHCNQNNAAAGDQTIFYGKEATMTISGNTLTVAPQDTRPQPEGYSVGAWTAVARQQYLNDWHAANPAQAAKLGEVESYSVTPGYDDTADHIAKFFKAIETRQHVVEDEVFGNNAAIACHMSNQSYFQRNVAVWDAATKTIKA